MLCIYMDGKVSMLFNRNCFPKNDRLFKVRHPTGSHIKHRKLFLHTTNRKYGLSIHAISNDLEGHSPNAGLFKCNLTNICVTFSTVLTDMVCHVVPR